MKKKTLVLGASLKENRYSNMVIHRLVAKGEEVYAIGLKEGEVSGVKIETKKKVFENIDTVILYLNPKRQQEYYNYVISLQPNRVIFNPGTENLEFTELLKKNDIEADIACTLVLLASNQY